MGIRNEKGAEKGGFYVETFSRGLNFLCRAPLKVQQEAEKGDILMPGALWERVWGAKKGYFLR
jgi:hypothetical protein